MTDVEKVSAVIRAFADRETCYEIEELADAILAALRPPFSVQVQQIAIPDQGFGGDTFVEKRDGKRLRKQQEAVEKIMSGGQWWTLKELHDNTAFPEASISARIRDAARSGRWRKERKNHNGTWYYRLVPTFSLAV